MSDPIPTALTGDVLAALRSQAAAQSSPFIDPVLFRAIQQVLPRVDGAWLTMVTGRTSVSLYTMDNAEMALIVHAAELDTDHIEDAREHKRLQWQQANWAATEASRAEDRAIVDEWHALAARLPVPVAVWHNWTARHLDGYEQGADHIVVLEDCHAGRLFRPVHRPLCWTPSRAHPLRHVAANLDDEHRLPDCKACLKIAHRLAAA